MGCCLQGIMPGTSLPSALRVSRSAARLLFWSVVGLIVSCGAASAAEFALDLGHTSIYFAVSHYDVSLMRGRFTKISGNVAFDAQAKNGAIAISVEADSVDTGNKVLDNVLRSAQFLDTARYPEMHFVSDRFVFDGDTLVAVDGTLTLRAVQRPLRLLPQRFLCKDVTAGLARRHVCGGEFQDRGRDTGYPIPPAQIPACAIHALGSHLG